MLRIKKLDLFIVKSFTLLFIGTFFICLFIFMMQFLWRYIDELVGKGLELKVLAEFFFYSALTLIPLSLPLAILLASLITFGNFGERYELLAMKAAGISLFKVMRPLIIMALFISGSSFYFQNIIAPKSQVKLWTLIVSMKQKSPELDIPEGVFYDGIEGYNLYVKSKNRDTGVLYGLLIYNFADGFENAHIIAADSGTIEMTADKKHLYLHLYTGEQFENLKSQNVSANNVPYRRETFREKHSIIEFDAEFNMVDAGFMSDQSMSKDMVHLQASIDSMRNRVDSIGRSFYQEAKSSAYKQDINLSESDSAKLTKLGTGPINIDSLYKSSSALQKQRVISSAVSRTENLSNDWSFKSFNVIDSDKSIRKHEIEWHNKITLSLACLIFFFIGAPLGAIIRKGGIGMPVVVSVMIFIVYYIINNTGLKMARDDNWDIWIGTWISSMVLAPLGAFLTYKSNKDSVVLNADSYLNWLKLIAGIRTVRHITKKEVIIEDPNYSQLSEELTELCNDCQNYLNNQNLNKAPNYVKIWLYKEESDEIKTLNNKLEFIIEQLSNSQVNGIINELNNYPVVAIRSHVHPFKEYWPNILAGILLPIGLFFYLRIWIFRKRLGKDLNLIIQTSKEIQNQIKKQVL